MTRLSLKARIYAGFAIIAALLVLDGCISFYSQMRLTRDMVAVQNVNSVNASILELARDVQELRLRVDRYVQSGQEPLQDEVLAILARIDNQLTALESESISAEMKEMLVNIHRHIQRYGDHFKAVVQERELRADLFQVQLPKFADSVDDAYAQTLSLLAGTPAVDQSRLILFESQNLFTQADKRLLRYFQNLDSRLINEMVNRLNGAVSNIEKIDAPDESTQVLLDRLAEFQRVALRAVQATRSYLFFRNVVMAGEESEVAYYSRSVREKAAANQKSIADAMVSVSQQTRRSSGVMIVIAAVLSIFIATRLAMLIVPPITSLTQTFERLAAGETEVDVQNMDRKDEIGLMTRAAQIFGDQNRKAQQLLTDLEAKAADLEKSNLELDGFAYVASHDLKSPLRGIRQLAIWIEEDSGELLPEGSVKHLQQLQQRVVKMEDLLNDLLDFSRVGRVVTEVETVDLASVLEEVIEITDNPEGVKVSWPAELPTAQCVRPALRQILLNLIVNAIKHNDKGANGRVDVTFRQDGDVGYFAVVDNGPGIDSSNHERVFQMYQRVNAAGVDGSGMGLAIVRKQVESFGGNVKLESELGEGATFKFSWPIQAESQVQGV